jgi:glycosyltransferase involved in cell wall biosynthesis
LDEPKYRKVFLLEKLTKFLITRYFAVSSTVKNTYVKKAGISPKKIALIPNGLESSLVNQASSQYKQKLGIPKTSLLLSCVAKLRPEKNHLLLLEIFNKFKAVFPDSALVLAGEGPEDKSIREYIKKHNLQTSVFLTGNIANVSELLSETDIFILLSNFEGMSNALLEALAAGCPILASDITPNRELIEDQKNGLLAPLSSLDIILEKLVSLAAYPELRQKMKQANLEKAKIYTLENTAKLFNQEINKLLN